MSWLAILIGAIVLHLVATDIVLLPRWAIVWSTAGLIYLAFRQTWQWGRRRGVPWADMSCLVMLLYFIKYGVGAVAVQYWDSLPWTIYPGLGQTFLRWGIWENLPTACVLSTLGCAGLFLGVSLPCPWVLGWSNVLRWESNDARLIKNLAWATPAIALMHIVLSSVVPLEYQYLLTVISWVGYLAAIVIAFLAASGNRLARKALVIVSLSLFFMLTWEGLITGMSGSFLTPVILLAYGALLSWGSISRRAVLIALVAGLIVVPYLAAYKATLGNPSSRIEESTREYREMGWQGRAELLLNRTVGRTASIAFVSLFAQHFPEHYPYEYGGTFLIEASSLVPRILWSAKPNVSQELNRYSERVGLISIDDTTSAVFDSVSEYYVNFGPLGVLAFCLLTGYYLRSIGSLLELSQPSPIGAALVGTLILINLDFMGIVQAIISHSRQLPVWIASLWLLGRGRTRANSY